MPVAVSCAISWRVRSTIVRFLWRRIHPRLSDEIESAYVLDPNGPPNPGSSRLALLLPAPCGFNIPGICQPRRPRSVIWRDGFSVEDGELWRYDDPAQAQILSKINSGYQPILASSQV
jgi:SEP domain